MGLVIAPVTTIQEGKVVVKLSRASSYALHAVEYMAAQTAEKREHPVASHHIAAARKIPDRFLLKVLKPLVSARILQSLKGPNGGYRLARPANKITLLEVVEAVDGQIRGYAPLAEEGRDQGSAGDLDSRLEAVCEKAAGELRKQLGKVRLSDLVDKG
jgi:Rrf2 family protein